MSDTTSLNPVPTARRGGASRSADRDEKITTLDATPPSPADLEKPHNAGVGIEGTPGNFQVTRPSADVVRSAVDRRVDDPEPKPSDVQYFRYVGQSDRKFKMPAGSGRDGYTATMRPGKVIDTVQYPLPALKSQGFIPGRNLEPISREEALAS